MTSTHDAQQVAEANASGRTPVVFVHGLWLLPSSWDRWATYFTEAGYAPVLLGWPDDPETVARGQPESTRSWPTRTVGDVADYLEGQIKTLSEKPAIVGPLVRRPARRDTRRPRAVPCLGGDLSGAVPRRTATAGLGAAVGLAGADQSRERHRAVPLTYEQFRYAFANAVDEDQAKRLYDEYRRAGTGRSAVRSRGR